MASYWYHGSPNQFEAFDQEWIGKGTDQLGSGHYFTNRKETARGYALKGKDGEAVESGHLLTVEIDIRRPLPDHAPISRKQIEQIIRAAPDFKDTMQSFGDVDYYGMERVMRETVNAYEGMNSDPDDNTLQMLFCLSNDFYRDEPARFLEVFSHATGYDGLYREIGDEIHAVVWDGAEVEIVDREIIQLATGYTP
ncbi:hypothetical protein G6L37_06695 [Agrobacterium rubi]|nr:hypothetical protein [Agrobacterium rubi]NTF25052.1 hypothetical protein [Agrobacterium rubi]